MKKVCVWIIGLGLLACAVPRHSVQAQGRGVIHIEKQRVEQVLEIYKAVTKVELVVSSNVGQAARSVTVRSEKNLTPEEMARLLEQSLLRQTGVVLTRVDDKRVSVTYNDRLELPVSGSK